MTLCIRCGLDHSNPRSSLEAVVVVKCALPSKTRVYTWMGEVVFGSDRIVRRDR